ncbi:MAG: hypothetical protein AAGD10_13325 [Myxococcota bacterium]
MPRGSALLLAACAMCTPYSRSGAPPPSPHPLPSLVKGAHLRPVGDARRGYGSRTARATMARLKAMGVNTIGVLMDGRMTDLEDRSVSVASRRELEPTRQALLDAHELGLATILVPHIYLDDGSWRGYLTLTDPVEAARWWRSYESFMLTAAELAEQGGASALSIGVELKGLSGRPETAAQMAHIADRVRGSYDGKLTYSANWDEAEDVVFWSSVDFIGVNGYYPLRPDPLRGAEQVAERLQALGARHERQVLLLEVGYRSSPLSHLRPWEWPEDIDPLVDEYAQARAWAAALTQWLGAPGIRGLVVWVVPSDPDDPASEPRHGFNPLNKKAESVLRRAFTRPPSQAALP